MKMVMFLSTVAFAFAPVRFSLCSFLLLFTSRSVHFFYSFLVLLISHSVLFSFSPFLTLYVLLLFTSPSVTLSIMVLDTLVWTLASTFCAHAFALRFSSANNLFIFLKNEIYYCC